MLRLSRFSPVIVFYGSAGRSALKMNNESFPKMWKSLCQSNYPVANVTTLHRFIEYFRRNAKYSMYTTQERETGAPVINCLANPVTMNKQMHKLDLTEIPSFIANLQRQKLTLSDYDFNSVLLTADKVCSEKIHHMDKESVLKVVYRWFLLSQKNLIHTNIYQKFMLLASNWLSEGNNKLEHIICIMFLVGMCKKNKEAQRIIKKCLQEIDSCANFLTLDEFCVVCHSSFKCSVRIRSANLLHNICHIIHTNIESLICDQMYLVSFMKVLRFAKHYDFHFMDLIVKKTHFNKILMMNVTSKVHILAMYAEALYDRKKEIPLLIQSCVKETYPSEKSNEHTVIRTKDISTLLWAASYLGYHISREDVQHMIFHLHNSVNQNYHLKKPEHFVGSILSLWMMGHKEIELFKNTVTKDFMRILEERQLFRLQARLSLLLTCIQIEMPNLLNEDHFKWKKLNIIPEEAIKAHLQKRIFLKYLFTAVANLGHHMKLHSICRCHVPNLNILGVTVTSPSGKVLHIEVLDNTVCLHETHTPHGLMKLKLRLLENAGHPILVVPDNKFDVEKDTAKLYMFLEEELKNL